MAAVQLRRRRAHLDTYRSALESALGSSREGPFDVDFMHDAAEVVAAVQHSDLVNVVLDGLDPVPDLDPYEGDEEQLADSTRNRRPGRHHAT